MTERENLLASIATTIIDYRSGELAAPTAQHVDRWVKQFGSDAQLPILKEMDHVVKEAYFSKQRVVDFLSGLIKNDKLVGSDPAAFWKNANFLNIQSAGGSQRDLLAIFDSQLAQELGFGTADCGADDKTFLYIDDAIFTGGRVKSDLSSWVKDTAPKKASLHVIAIAIHEGYYYNRDRILEEIKKAGKTIEITWWRLTMLENRKINRDSSDVLWPTQIPDDIATRAYVANMAHQPVFRTPGQVGQAKLFSNDDGRQLLEQEFLKAGVRIRGMCPNLPEIERPLGHSYLETLGFGTTLTTFRNCPNNAPLALWAGDPWYPLFPRKTNTDSSLERFKERLRKLRR
jgi:hypothetical protein